MRSRAASTATTTASLLLLVAVPAMLVHLGAWPTRGVPSADTLREWVRQPLTGGFLAGLAQAGAWLIWALLAAAVLTRVYTRVTRTLRWLPTLHLPGPLQGLTAAVLGATAVTASTTGVPAQAAQPGAGITTTEHETMRSAPAEPANTRPVDTALSQPDPTPAAPRHDSYTVRRGDTLSEIADRCLGDPHRWPEIFALNRGTHFGGTGGTLRDPNLIYPGWTLDLPTTTPPAHQPRPPTPPPAVNPPPQPDDVETATPSPAATTPTDTTPRTPPPPVSAPASPAESTTATDTASTDPDGSATSGHRRQGVTLPSGSWVDIGLALAITAAVALVWAHRRRRYVPRPPTAEPRATDPDLTPMPLVVNQIRRALRRISAHHTRAIGHGGHDELDNDLHDETSSAPPDDDPEAATWYAGDPDVTGGRSQSGTDPLLAVQPHALPEVWPPAGLGLAGPGAHAAARGFLTAALAAGGLEHPDDRTQAVLPSTTATTLLGAAAVNLPRTPRLTVTADLDDALNILEAQMMHRARLIDRQEVDTVAGLRATDPYEEPLPPIMLLADPTTRPHRARIAALLTQGQRLDIHGVLLGEWPDGATINVAEDGITTTTDGECDSFHPAELGRLTVINATEAADLLATLAESHTGQLPAPAPTETAPTPAHIAPAQPTDPLTPLQGRQQAQTQTPADTSADPAHSGLRAGPHIRDTPATSATTTSTPLAPLAAQDTGAPAPPQSSGPSAADPDTATADPNPTDEKTPADTHGPVQVTVLGAPRITNGDPHRKLRAKSLELLVYLAVRDGNASTEAILDDLLPDAPARKAVHRLHTYVSDLRGVLRHTGGPGTYLTHPHHRYQLHPERFDIDLWRMRAAIRAADTAPSTPERITALRRAVDTYRNPLAEGSEYEWLEPYREQVRQEALDAAIALIAELTDQPAEQLEVLDVAISQHPYAEGLYQAAMRARAQLGDLDTVHALRRTLTRRLVEIDAEPCDDTLALADQLITDLRRAGRASRTRRPRDGAPR
ncbi:hypothetical protein B0E53_04974 [Micromonospora sp. MH33]|uniref:BTAD domain-containing putative transcriptional regulator n=1 Tax=Micromonospora sp. MH33 TaxID=1945509 RepID=UPI000D14A116|nr:BTAD domain-containing putative transcriptional regulator [Micromonospora sp. MH33]PSK63105.1 hypothetical protein B0E53_04974 [Micromonospora sp. MH33]